MSHIWRVYGARTRRFWDMRLAVSPQRRVGCRATRIL